MKRSVWLLILLALAFSFVLIACAAPAPAAPQVIKETVVVEKETIVTATPPPAPEPVTLVVWDFKSNEPAGAPYYQKADASFMEAHPGVTIERVAQPHTEYYQILGTAIAAKSGPDVILFHPGASILDRKEALLPLNDYVSDIKDRIVGWSDFSDDEGNIYAVPITMQGLVIYYNKAIYNQAGLDPENPPTTWDGMVQACDTIMAETGKKCFTFGDKEGWNADWWLTVMLNGMMTDEEMAQWVNGEFKMTDPKPLKSLQLLAEAAERGWFPEGAASLAMFPDSFEVFERGDAAHVIGLTSDVANWKEFADFIGDKNLGVIKGLIIDPEAVPSYDDMRISASGGIGFAVANWTQHPELAAELAKWMASKENLENYFLYAGAMVPSTDFDKALMPSEAGKTILDWQACCAGPTGHQWMPTAVMQEHERQGQLLLTGAVTPEAAAEAIQKVWDETVNQ